MVQNVSEAVDAVHQQVHEANPFQDQEEYAPRSVMLYKIGTTVSWLLLVITSFYYTFERPHEGKYSRHTIWGQNHRMHTPFAWNPIIESIYWLVLFISQVGYVSQFWSSSSAYVTSAANVGPHFITSNLLLFGFVHLWTRSYFWLAELLLLINFVNLSSAYFRHSKSPKLIHVPAVSGPLAWNYVAIYWVGAAMVHSHTLAARIIANIFIWGILAYGMFFLAAYKDWSMGVALSIHAAAIGVSQFLTHVIAFQWIFAFIIMGILFVLSIPVAFPEATGSKDYLRRGEIVSEDRERAPLLADE